jgi:hypothetical protein
VSHSGITAIADLNMIFSLTNPRRVGALNGDNYVSLQHESGFSVLLYRVVFLSDGALLQLDANY